MAGGGRADDPMIASMSPQAEALIGLLKQAGSRLGSDLADSEHLSLRDYLAGLLPPPLRAPNSSFLKLQDAVTIHLACIGVRDAELWAADLRQHPLIQQADHSFLLLDQETLLNNLLFALAAEMAGARRILTIQCSSVSCISRRRPLRGSPFLTRGGAIYNVFGFSKRLYARSVFLSLPRPVRTVFATLEGRGSSLAADPFLGRFVGRDFPDALEAYRQINAALWRDLSTGFQTSLAIGDDALTGELIAQHFEDSSSPLRRLVFDPQARDLFMCRKRALIESPLNLGVNRPEPDHFWIIEKGSPRLRAMRFEPRGTEPQYETSRGWRPCPFPFTPENVAAALRRGEIVPDIILTYLARCLLPGVDAVGGASQQDYVALYQRLLLDCDDALGLLEPNERATAARAAPSRLGGAPLLEVTDELGSEFERLVPGISARALFEPYLDRSLAETIGRLECGQYLAGHAARAMEMKREHSWN